MPWDYAANTTYSAISGGMISYPVAFIAYSLALIVLIIVIVRYRKSILGRLVIGGSSIIIGHFFYWTMDWASVQATRYGNYDLAYWCGWIFAAIGLGYILDRFIFGHIKRLLRLDGFLSWIADDGMTAPKESDGR